MDVGAENAQGKLNHLPLPRPRETTRSTPFLCVGAVPTGGRTIIILLLHDSRHRNTHASPSTELLVISLSRLARSRATLSPSRPSSRSRGQRYVLGTSHPQEWAPSDPRIPFSCDTGRHARQTRGRRGLRVVVSSTPLHFVWFTVSGRLLSSRTARRRSVARAPGAPSQLPTNSGELELIP